MMSNITHNEESVARLRAMAGWLRNLADTLDEESLVLAETTEQVLNGNLTSAVEWADDAWTEYLS